MGYDVELDVKLRDHGLNVREVAGWRTRGSEDFAPRGSVTHNTVGARDGNAPSLAVVTFGHKRLAGPLSNVLQARDNTIFLVAAGRCNHAGEGGWEGLTGNRQVYGNEVENIGTPDEPWRDDQVDTMVRVAAAFAEGNHDPYRACFHKEWAPKRKIDAHTLSGPRFRDRLVRYLTGAGLPVTAAPVIEPRNPGEPDMFLVLEGIGLFAVVDGIPIGFADIQEYADARAASPGIPTMTLSGKQAGDMNAWMLRKLEAATS